MDFDPAQHAALLTALLLIPGLFFLVIVVIYVAFIGRSSSAKPATMRTCLKCGRTLLPDQAECPDCVPQVIPPVSPQPPPPEPQAAEPDEQAPEPPAPSPSSAYEGEIVDEPEQSDQNP